MKLFTTTCILTTLLLTGCNNKHSNVWDDDSTAGNYTGNSRSLFISDDLANAEEDLLRTVQEEFVALQDNDLTISTVDNVIAQPRFSPGEAGSGVPGIDGFHSPTGRETSIFENVHFKTDDHILRDNDSLETINHIVSYMKQHPNTHLFIEGHADERAPEAYNLALGARRANYIRTLLAQKGVNPEHLHTISYGKEKPIALGHNENSWWQNRRGQFKLFTPSNQR